MKYYEIGENVTRRYSTIAQALLIPFLAIGQELFLRLLLREIFSRTFRRIEK